MKLPQDFKEFIELMIANSVQFVMIGGYAYNLYRNPRATGDIDFIVAADRENQNRLRAVLIQFGFGTTLPPADQLLMHERKILMLGRSPFRIDLMTEVDGVTSEEIFRSHRDISIDDLIIPVIAPEVLLKNKLAAARPKDLADAAELSKWLDSGG